jgi:hypothetical protein
VIQRITVGEMVGYVLLGAAILILVSTMACTTAPRGCHRTTGSKVTTPEYVCDGQN